MGPRNLLRITLALLAAGTFACNGDDTPPAQPPSISTESLPSVTAGRPYNVVITATGGGAGYTWTVSDGQLPDGLTLGAMGTPSTTLSGTPTAPGTFNFDIMVTDDNGMSDSNSFTINVSEEIVELTIEMAQLGTGTLGENYTAQISANGGSGDYAWSLAGGVLPPGVSLSPQGTPSTTLAGTPTEAGTFSFAVRVADAAGNAVNGQFEIVVIDPSVPLNIDTVLLVNGAFGVAYTQQITASGGSGTDYVWEVTSGTLPDGLTLDASGTPSTQITGTPTTDGDSVFEITVTDSDGNRAVRNYSITIAPEPPPIRITTFALPDAQEGEAYTAPITTRDGTGAGYAWTVSSGTLPAGITLDATGTPDTTLSGTPTEAGSFTFTLTVTDGTKSDDQLFQLEIAPIIIPIQIVTSSVPDGIEGEVYTGIFEAANGTPPYNWVITEGSIAPGLTLITAGTPATTISGTPISGGTFTATVTVFDRNNATASIAISMFVEEVQIPIVVTIPATIDISFCTPFTTGFSADGGSSVGFMWTVSAGTLPPGITLDPTGTPNSTLRGTSGDQAMSIPLTIRVTDNEGTFGEASTVLNIAGVTVPDRYTLMIGDILIDNDIELHLGDICAPGDPFALNQTPVIGGDVALTNDYIRIAPDNSFVVFVGDLDVDNQNDVYYASLVNPTARSSIRLSPAMVLNGDVTDVRISPDSNKVTFIADYETDNVIELYMVNVTNRAVPSAPMKLNGPMSASSDVNTDDVRFSPDSTKVVYHADEIASAQDNLYIVDVTNPAAPGTRQLLYPPFTTPTSMDADDGFQFSPDSNWVYYIADPTLGAVEELWRVNISGATPTAPERINGVAVTGGDVFTRGYDFTPGLDYLAQDWDISPDGTKLFYNADETIDNDNTLFVVDLTVTPPTRAPVAIPVSLGDVQYARWMPDSNGILVFGDVVTDNVNELFFVNVTTPGTPGPLLAVSPSFALNANGDVLFSQRDGFGITPDGMWVWTISDVTDTINELYLTDMSGATPGTPVKVSMATPPSTFDVDTAFSNPSSTRLVYRADPVLSGQSEFFMVDLASGTPAAPVRVNGPMVSGGDVSTIQPDTSWLSDDHLLFESDQVTDNVFEAWVVDLNGQVPYVQRRASGVIPTNGDVSIVRSEN